MSVQVFTEVVLAAAVRVALDADAFVDQDRAAIGVVLEANGRRGLAPRVLHKLKLFRLCEVGAQGRLKKVPDCPPKVLVPPRHVTQLRRTFLLFAP